MSVWTFAICSIVTGQVLPTHRSGPASSVFCAGLPSSSCRPSRPDAQPRPLPAQSPPLSSHHVPSPPPLPTCGLFHGPGSPPPASPTTGLPYLYPLPPGPSPQQQGTLCKVPQHLLIFPAPCHMGVNLSVSPSTSLQLIADDHISQKGPSDQCTWRVLNSQSSLPGVPPAPKK